MSRQVLENKIEREGVDFKPQQELFFCFHDFMGSGYFISDHKVFIEYTKQTGQTLYYQ